VCVSLVTPTPVLFLFPFYPLYAQWKGNSHKRTYLQVQHQSFFFLTGTLNPFRAHFSERTPATTEPLQLCGAKERQISVWPSLLSAVIFKDILFKQNNHVETFLHTNFLPASPGPVLLLLPRLEAYRPLLGLILLSTNPLFRPPLRNWFLLHQISALATTGPHLSFFTTGFFFAKAHPYHRIPPPTAA